MNLSPFIHGGQGYLNMYGDLWGWRNEDRSTEGSGEYSSSLRKSKIYISEQEFAIEPEGPVGKMVLGISAFFLYLRSARINHLSSVSAF